MTYWRGGFTNIVKKWIVDGCLYSPNKMGHFGPKTVNRRLKTMIICSYAMKIKNLPGKGGEETWEGLIVL